MKNHYIKILLANMFLMTLFVTIGKSQVISSLNPVSGNAGATVTISGTGFSATPANNIVYFGNVRATVSDATTTSLTVAVPTGASSFAPVSVIVAGKGANSLNTATPMFNVTIPGNVPLSYGAAASYGVGISPYGIASGDFNNDGNVDIVTANSSGASVSILLGAGNGTFASSVAYTVGSSPMRTAVSDFNGDGILDIVTANISSNNISVLLGAGVGDGTFGTAVNYTAGSGPYSVISHDFNNDGYMDIAVSNFATANVSVFTGIGNGTFNPRVNFAAGSDTRGIAAGDVNNDGKLDIVTANSGNGTISVLIGDGAAGFAAAVSYTAGAEPSDVDIADFDQDNDMDIVVTDRLDNTIGIFINDGSGIFGSMQTYPAGSNLRTVEVCDLNGDGFIDLAIGAYNSGIYYHVGNASGTFPTNDYKGSPGVMDAIEADFNNDGIPDLASVNNNGTSINVYLNNYVPCVVNIPDANFKAALVADLAINTNSDNEIQCTEASAFVDIIYANDLNISNLTGIEAFTGLTGLNCGFNQLTSFDLSANTALTLLSCDNNLLTSLDVSANTTLYQLYCNNNQLTSLDVSANTVLDVLHCGSNQLTSLDVSANTVLDVLHCGSNQLTSLNVSANTALTALHCFANQLTSLNVSANTALTALECGYNLLTSLDVSANTALNGFECMNNQLTSLDVSSNTALIQLYCSHNQLTSLNIANGNNTNFITFEAYNNSGLTCVKVDNPANFEIAYPWASRVGTVGGAYSADCGATAAEPNALSFDGSDDYVQISNPIIGDGDNFTTECWFNFTSTPASQKIIMQRGLDGSGPGWSFSFAQATNNTLSASIVTGALQGHQVLAANPISMGWHHLAATWNSSSKTLTFYLNGIQQGTATATVSTLRSSTVSFLFGKGNAPSESPAGQMDEARIWNVVRTNCQIQQAMNTELFGNEPGLVSYYKFNQGTAGGSNTGISSITDGTANNNNGTLNGFALTGASSNFITSGVNFNGVAQFTDTFDPIPNVTNLSDITAECEITTLTAPTATDVCAGTITANHNASLPIITQGTSLVTWTYTDGSNSVTQTQNVILADLTDPTISCVSNQTKDISSPATLYTVSGNEFDPATTNDNCGVASTSNDFNSTATLAGAQFPIGTTTVIWTVSDVAGNTAICSYTVTVNQTGGSGCVGNVYIPDASFKAALVADLAINTNADGEIQCTEAAAFTGGINIDGTFISDLTGLEAFTALTALSCSGNAFTSLDVTANTALTALSCAWSTLTSLNISTNTALTELNCSNNPLASLDVSANTALTLLSCDNNQLTSLDVSANTALTQLDCRTNQLTSLNVSANTALTALECGYNLLTSLDVSANTALNGFDCSNNQLTSLDVSSNTALIQLYCSNNQLTSLNIANGNNTNFITFEAYDNSGLTCIKVDNPATFEIAYPYVSHVGTAGGAYSANCGCVGNVYIPNANFKAALVANTGINTNSDTEIQCTEAAAFVGGIFVNFSNISDLTGIEAFTALTVLYCGGNQLTSLDVSANTALTKLYCNDNQLISLDVLANTALTKLACSQNQLANLDVLANTALIELYCNNNQLTRIDVSANNEMRYLFCGNNQLTSLNLKNGNNQNMSMFATGNPGLSCIQVDDPAWATANWTVAMHRIDAGVSFSSNCAGGCVVDIPDANFRNAVLAHNPPVDINHDGYIQCSEAAAFTGYLLLYSKNIQNTTGIEAFTQLDSLNLTGNPFTQINLSANTALKYLVLIHSNVSTLSLLQNTLLTFLLVTGPNLSSLDISANDALKDLHIDSDLITQLDVTNKALLENLHIKAKITEINLSANTQLKSLAIQNSNLIELDVSANTQLTSINCSDNNLTKLNIANGHNASLTSFSATGNPGLSCVQVDNVSSMQTAFNYSSYVGGTGSYSTNCSTCLVSFVDPDFKALLVGKPEINTNGDAQIQCAEAAAFTGHIIIAGSNISSLSGIESFTKLKNLWVVQTSITNIDLSLNTALSTLFLYQNQSLGALDVTHNTALTTLGVSESPITSLNVLQNNALEELSCPTLQLTTLNVTNNGALKKLDCRNNQLNSLDVSHNIALKDLQCYNNDLTSLDVSHNIALTDLLCDNNELTLLDVSLNIALTHLTCNNNQLTSLNVKNGHNASLTNLVCESNQNLTCIQVDNAVWSAANWTNQSYFSKPSGASYSNDCSECLVNIPDANFKAALLAHNPPIDINHNGKIECSEAAAYSGQLKFWGNAINNFQGIEEFTSLTGLSIGFDYSANSINLSALSALTSLELGYTTFSTINVSSNANLRNLIIGYMPQLDKLLVNNGNNLNFTGFIVRICPNLSCIQVDNPTWATANWTVSDQNIDAGMGFSANCANPGYTVSGNMFYYYTPSKIIPNSTAQLFTNPGNVLVQSVACDAAGKYNFTNIPAGNYRLNGLTTHPWGGMDAADLQGMIETSPFVDPLKYIQTPNDVNGDFTSSSASDLLLMQQRLNQVISTFPAGDWNEARSSLWNYYFCTEISVTQSLNNTRIIMFCYGDENHSYLSSGGSKSIVKTEIENSGSIIAQSSDFVEIPVYAGTEAEIGAMVIALGYDASKVDVLSVTASENMPGLMWNVIKSRVRMTWVKPQHYNMQPGDLMFTLKVKAKTQDLNDVLFTTNDECTFSNTKSELIGVTMLIPSLKVTGKELVAPVSAFDFMIYPVPVTEKSFIGYSLPSETDVQITVYDVSGKQVLNKTISKQSAGWNSTELNTSGLPAGMYQCRFVAGSDGNFISGNKKFVVIK